jgi:polar amino acid transport system substrate-binding protein
MKINSTIDYSLKMYLQIEKKDSKFLDLINSAINRITKDEEKIILNNYQQILYHDRIDYIQFLKYILPLVILLLVFVFFNIKLKKEIHRRREVEAQLLNFANKDSLTNIFNRRKIEEICEKEILRSKRYGTHFSIIFFDLNDFKIINDKLGHHIGDEVLVKVTNIINKNIREIDSFGRWGGDEFLIILPQTNKNQAKTIILTLENNINDLTFSFNNELKVSCSFGISEYEKGDTLDSLLKKADESMYTTKAMYKKELSKKT